MEDSTNFTYEYLPHRGISKKTFEFYDCFSKIDGEGKPVSIGFKYPSGTYKVRSLTEKKFRTEPAGTELGGLFGMNKFSAGSHKYVTITEGEYDALSLHQVLGSPCVSVSSSAVAGRDCADAAEWLRSFERIYLAFDNDQAGQRALRDVAQLFDYNRVFVVKLTKHKDANEYLQHGEAEELRQCWWNSKKYLPDNIVSSLQEFTKILSTPPTTGYRVYPSAQLNDMTYGVRKGETVLITAMEGVGKTELIRNIEYNLLKGTPHAIASICPEEPNKRHLQGLAGLELGRPVHLPDTAASPDEVGAAIAKVIGADDRLHLYSHFGSDDPDAILDLFRFLVVARGCAFLIWDHIGMAVSGLKGEADERRALDYLSTRAEMLVKDLNFGLILVSHVNAMGGTRGSALISKNCDIRIDLERDHLSEDPVVRNTLNLRVSKNRPIGETGPAGSLIFDSKTHTYVGAADPFTPPANDNNKIAINAA